MTYRVSVKSKFILFFYKLTSLYVIVSLLLIPLFAVTSCPLWDVGMETEEFLFPTGHFCLLTEEPQSVNQ